MKSLLIVLFLSIPCVVMAQNQNTVETLNNYGVVVFGQYIKKETTNNITYLTVDTLAIERIMRKEIDSALSKTNELLVGMRQELANNRTNNEAKDEKIGQLEETVAIYESIVALMQERKKELEDKEYCYLPFGVYQFTHDQTGKGLLFAIGEGGLLLTSVGYYISSQCNFQKHNDNSYDQWERDRFYERYRSQRCTAGGFLALTALAIGVNYCDNFNWFRKNNVQTAAIPIMDHQGNVQISATLSMKF